MSVGVSAIQTAEIKLFGLKNLGIIIAAVSAVALESI
jgi:hypothetical protein